MAEPEEEHRPSPPPPPTQPSEQALGSPEAAPTNKNAEQIGDPKTQKQMAWSTVAIAFFAFCSFVVGVLQWNAMLGQLKEMKNSSADTRALATAASRQATASEEANRNALNAERPWMGVMVAVANFEVDQTPTITIAYVNSGRRPAKVTRTEYRWTTYDVFPENPEYAAPTTMASTNIVLPNARSDVTLTVDKITEPQMWVWKSRSRSFYIHTNIEYEDPVTNARHWTHACWQYVWFEKGIRSGFYNCPKYNEAN